MKIAHIHAGIRGIASYAINIYNFFKDKSEYKTLIVSEAPWHKQPIELFQPRSSYLLGILPWAWFPKEVYRKMDEYQPDILHHHHPSGRLDFHIRRLQERTGAKLVCTFHMSVGSHTYFIDKVMHRFFKMVRPNFVNADCYVAISHFVRDQLLEVGGVPPEKIVTLYAGVNPEIYAPLPFEEHDTLEVTFIGEITDEKGIPGLLDTVHRVAEHRKIRLSLVGRGRSLKKLQKKTRDWPEINWVGFVKGQAEIAKVYSRSDVTVLPNLWEEAFSYIPLEALSCGTAVYASRIGGNTEIVQEGVSGRLFEPGNYDKLFELLRDADIQELKQMGAQGREHILKKHTLQLFGDKYTSLYRNLMEDPGNIQQID